MTRGKISQMLLHQGRHVSFHTPGHKRAGADITELSYSDNLYAPHGVIREAEEEIAKLLGASRTFFLTDGSTAGVHAMLYALKTKGASSVALSPYSHPSVLGGCRLLDLHCVFLPVYSERGIPVQPDAGAMRKALESADALLLTSPDYYGFFPDLHAAQGLCKEQNKPLVIDGAHGSHLHGTPLYAGRFADMWVDGAHKSLPALTQGAAVSCIADWAEALEEGVRLFHTSSPSYPILASVEEAFLYPRNAALEEEAKAFKRRAGALENGDWTKIILPFKDTRLAQKRLEEKGIYPEFNDGNYLMFYLSPCTKRGELKKLERALRTIPPCAAPEGVRDSLVGECAQETERIPLQAAIGRRCAEDCGIFPPSLPVVRRGELIEEDAVRRLKEGVHTFGITDGTIRVYIQRP